MVDIEKMFDEISSNYDFLNNVISFFTHKKVKKYAIDKLDIFSGARVLDLCAGSGDFGIIVKEKIKDSEVFGVDISEKMLDIAKKRNKDIIYLKEDAKKLSFKDGYFDFVITAFGFRNVEEKSMCANEIYRVLKKGGKLLHLDFGRKNIVSFLYNCVLIFFIKFFFKQKDAYFYLINSKNKFMTPDKLISFFEDTGFKFIYRKDLFFGIISFQVLGKG